LPSNVDHYQMKYSNKAAEQLALRKAGNLWWYEPVLTLWEVF
jgi:hypothetical protein